MDVNYAAAVTLCMITMLIQNRTDSSVMTGAARPGLSRALMWPATPLAIALLVVGFVRLAWWQPILAYVLASAAGVIIAVPIRRAAYAPLFGMIFGLASIATSAIWFFDK